MAVIIHVSSESDNFAVFGSVYHLFLSSDLLRWGVSPLVSGFEVRFHVIKVIFFRLTLNFHEFVVILDVLVARILRIKWVVHFFFINRPNLLTIVN